MATPLVSRPKYWLPVAVGLALMTGCSSISSVSQSDSEAPMQAEMQAVENKAAGAADQAMPVEPPAPVPSAPQAQPQLAKRAEIFVVVESVEDSIKQASAIATNQQGDLLNLNDQVPLSATERQTATMQIRVPQAKLDATLGQLAELGTVQRRTISAEDVSNQLIDLQARLRNLRKTEEMLLEIMDRSGSIGDVLSVAQELNNVRASIEQIDAQRKSLQGRVDYSIIDIRLESAIATTTPQQAIGTQLSGTWQQATHSVQDFSVDLLQLSLWILVYSPYLLVVALIALAGYRVTHHRRPTPAIATEETE